MKIIFSDAKGRIINMECDPKDKISTLLQNLEAKYKFLHPEDSIRSISIAFDGEIYTNETNEDINLEELGIEDDCKITFSILYNGGLI